MWPTGASHTEDGAEEEKGHLPVGCTPLPLCVVAALAVAKAAVAYAVDEWTEHGGAYAVDTAQAHEQWSGHTRGCAGDGHERGGAERQAPCAVTDV